MNEHPAPTFTVENFSELVTVHHTVETFAPDDPLVERLRSDVMNCFGEHARSEFVETTYIGSDAELVMQALRNYKASENSATHEWHKAHAHEMLHGAAAKRAGHLTLMAS